MKAQVEFGIDSEKNLCMTLKIQCENELPLLHQRGIKLEQDPIKSLLRLYTIQPVFEFEDVTALSSDRAIAKVKDDAQADEDRAKVLAELRAKEAEQAIVAETNAVLDAAVVENA